MFSVIQAGAIRRKTPERKRLNGSGSGINGAQEMRQLAVA